MFNKQAFNRGSFEVAFAQALDALGQAESITRRELRDVSRSILTAIHCTEDSAFLNRLIGVLTPVNKRTMVLFLKHFSGFHYDEKIEMFTKKNKPTYEKAAIAASEFLSDPNQNVWTWSNKLKVEHEKEPYDVAVVTKYISNALKKAKENGATQAQVFKAILEGGLTMDTVLDMMDELGYAEVVDAA